MSIPGDPVDRILDDLGAFLGQLHDDGVDELEFSSAAPAEPAPHSHPELAQSGDRLAPPAPLTDAAPNPPPSEPTDAAAAMIAAGRDLQAIAGRVAVCARCPLHAARTKTVPGQGNARPGIMFVGEGPGADEDAQGLAFVGRAGQLLTRLIARMGYRREDVFIANIVKCRPPENRKPLPEEMTACLPFLREQIGVLKPRVIVTLGATALEGLAPALGKVFITRLRGQWMEYEGIPLMPTLHPSYLLRNESAMWDVLRDMEAVLKRLGRTLPPKKSG